MPAQPVHYALSGESLEKGAEVGCTHDSWQVQMPLHMISDKLDLKGPVNIHRMGRGCFIGRLNTLWLKELNAEEKEGSAIKASISGSLHRGLLQSKPRRRDGKPLYHLSK